MYLKKQEYNQIKKIGSMKGSWYKVHSAGTLMQPCASDDPILSGTRTYTDVGSHHLFLWQQFSLSFQYTSNFLQSVKSKKKIYIEISFI